ncbi:hypothetical protein H8Z72_23310 (plasmid) [Xanthomonas citri pv. citri]|uniref:hypothetical protein n=1 Tax=Xanthomonas citri TaxID=346 RepID=UPI001934767F|nr:hypothetical protein [Xanthomonas citri]QRD62757.1 hypothetical protein H8Z74_22875 [Xanthomonas citri pv. citri]QRD67084.1 hypothetical protein H8Z73_22960 [Xanthomonas citri pv. citri]QRD71663.1 hypothetical protein H8Z72_23310 [Xanthomonas citri pv. citri]
MLDPEHHPWIFIITLLSVACAGAAIDFAHRRFAGSMCIKPLPTEWILEAAVWAMALAAVGAVAGVVSEAIFHARSIAGLLMGPVALTGLVLFCALFGATLVRDGLSIPVTPRHPSNSNYAGKHHYAYRLRKEWSGVYSLHVARAKFYQRKVSDMSISHCTDAILDSACRHLQKGDVLILATPYIALRTDLNDSVEAYFRKRKVTSIKPHTYRFPPVTGAFLNCWHSWGHPRFARITATGAKITL